MRVKNYDGQARILTVYKEDKLEVGCTAHGNQLYLTQEKRNLELLEDDSDCGELAEGDLIEIYPNGYVKTICSASQEEFNLILSNQCNSNCIMCPMPETVRRKENGSSLRLLKIIELLPEAVKYVSITGGEPTLANDSIFLVLNRLKEQRSEICYQFLTNGRSFSDINFADEILSYMPKHCKFDIPLHASTAELHDKITQSKGSFEQTVAGLKHLVRRKAFVEIRIVVSKLNYLNLETMAAFIVSNFYGIQSVIFIGLEMTGNAYLNRDKVWIDYKQSFVFMKPAIDLLIAHGIDVDIYNYPLCCIGRGYWSIAADSITRTKIRYDTVCEACKVKSMCGGLFASTQKFLVPTLKAIRE